MTELNPPGFLQNRTDHPARELRGAISGLIATAGIVTLGDWTVTQRGAGANMSVDIAGGSGYVLGTENVNQGYYHCVSDATIVNKAVGASSGTQARKDIVVARVYDQFYSGATNLWQFEVIAGAFGTGTEPAVPANSYKVATIDIAISAVSIITANITPRTQQYAVNHTPIFVANQAARDALVAYDGLQVYRLDLHLVETYNGTAWISPGIGATATKSSSQAITGNVAAVAVSFGAEISDTSGFHDNVTNNSRITVPAGMGGKYLIIGKLEFITGSVPGNSILGLNRNGSAAAGIPQLSRVSLPDSGAINGTAVFDLAAGDYIELMISVATSATLQSTAAQYMPGYFSVVRLSA